MSHISGPKGPEHFVGRFLLRRHKSAGLGPTPSNAIDYRAELERSKGRFTGGRTEAYSCPNRVTLKSGPKCHPFKAPRPAIDLELIIKFCSIVYVKWRGSEVWIWVSMNERGLVHGVCLAFGFAAQSAGYEMKRTETGKHTGRFGREMPIIFIHPDVVTIRT